MLPRLCSRDDVLKIVKDTVMGGTHDSKPGWKSFGLKNSSILWRWFRGLKESKWSVHFSIQCQLNQYIPLWMNSSWQDWRFRWNILLLLRGTNIVASNTRKGFFFKLKVYFEGRMHDRTFLPQNHELLQNGLGVKKIFWCYLCSQAY